MLRFHARHAHVPGGKATVDRRDVTLSKAKEREELDRRASVCHRDRNMIRIEYHLVTPCHQRRALGRAGLPPPGELPATGPPVLARLPARSKRRCLTRIFQSKSSI
jgi:hypothetical protein